MQVFKVSLLKFYWHERFSIVTVTSLPGVAWSVIKEFGRFLITMLLMFLPTKVNVNCLKYFQDMIKFVT